MGKVSVIIPCYNLGAYIDDAVDSVLNQTHNNFEIIIINDGSSDEGTVKKLSNYKKPNCKVINTKNNGLAVARNYGLKLAKGEYIQFLDADDVLEKDKFELQISQLKNATENSLSYCDYFASDETDLTKPYPTRYLNPKFKTNNYLKELITHWETKLSIPCHCFLFERRIFTENNIFFDESLPNHEDWDCWMKIFGLKPEVHYINKKLATYRIRQSAMCKDPGLMKQGFLNAIRKQKQINRNNKAEYKLLSKRFNLISFGFSSEFICLAISCGFLMNSIRIFKKVISFGRERLLVAFQSFQKK
jgi:hypothetical protein